MNANNVRKQFLEEHASYVINKFGSLMRGEVDTNCDQAILYRMWDLLEKVILEATDIESVEAKSVDSVLALLAKGKIDPNMALKLMDLLKTKQDIEELPKLREAIEKLTSDR